MPEPSRRVGTERSGCPGLLSPGRVGVLTARMLVCYCTRRGAGVLGVMSTGDPREGARSAGETSVLLIAFADERLEASIPTSLRQWDSAEGL